MIMIIDSDHRDDDSDASESLADGDRDPAVTAGSEPVRVTLAVRRDRAVTVTGVTVTASHGHGPGGGPSHHSIMITVISESVTRITGMIRVIQAVSHGNRQPGSK